MSEMSVEQADAILELLAGNIESWIAGKAPLMVGPNEAEALGVLLHELRDCQRDHPPEPQYTEWCNAGKPDVSVLLSERARLVGEVAAAQNRFEAMSELATDRGVENDMLREALGRVVALSDSLGGALPQVVVNIANTALTTAPAPSAPVDVETIVKAADRLIEVVDAAAEPLKAVCVYAAVHGQDYRGPSWHDELEALRAAVKRG